MKCGILSVQKKWIFKAVDPKSRKTIVWVTDNRDIATFKKCTTESNS